MERQAMTSAETAKSDYWERYYSGEASSRVPPPSQFAAFVAQEAEEGSTFIDVGCGSGRDGLFFAQRGFALTGIDASHAAVDHCRDIAARMGLAHASFVCASVDSTAFGAALASAVAASRGKAVLSARFFLHAITEEEQAHLFDAAASALRPGDLVAVEDRTTRDASLAKETSSHYRRFIDPAQLIVEMAGRGFAVEYAVEGFGFAKYRHDDAHVARAVFRKA
jgi:cyclopropane fatty-acyl-phospholipid synthase-like methyltransferase